MLASYFIGGVALDALGTAVPAYDAALFIQHIDRVIRDALNQYLKLRRSVLQLPLGLARLRQFAGENVDLLPQIGNGGSISARGRWRFAVPRLLSLAGA
jgi:hypothetical protein